LRRTAPRNAKRADAGVSLSLAAIPYGFCACRVRHAAEMSVVRINSIRGIVDTPHSSDIRTGLRNDSESPAHALLPWRCGARCARGVWSGCEAAACARARCASRHGWWGCGRQNDVWCERVTRVDGMYVPGFDIAWMAGWDSDAGDTGRNTTMMSFDVLHGRVNK
jgi:hypothetical protein